MPVFDDDHRRFSVLRVVSISCNIVFLGIAAWSLNRGFTSRWELSVLPIVIAATGMFVGLGPGWACAAINAISAIGSAVPLCVSAVLSFMALSLLIWSSDPTAAANCVVEARSLTILGLLAIVSGILAWARLRKAERA